MSTIDEFPLFYHINQDADDQELRDAVHQNDVEAAERLLWLGAYSRLSDQDGFSLLHYAVDNLRFEMIYLLVRFGANPFSMDADGETPMSLLQSKMDEYTEEDYKNQNPDLINLAQVKSLFMSKE